MQIIAKSENVKKPVLGRMTEINAVAFGAGRWGSYGFGYQEVEHERGLYWGTAVEEKKLFHAWRAMRLLTHAPCIKDHTVRAIWALANGPGQGAYSAETKQAVELLRRDVEQYESDAKISMFFARAHNITHSYPSESGFKDMLDRCLATLSYGTIREIAPLVQSGKLPHLPQVDELARLCAAEEGQADPQIYFEENMLPARTIGL